jgi:oxygen-independent coproporphyrinogen III oxidase
MMAIVLQPFKQLSPKSAMFDLPASPAEVPGLYVHVPFCFHKCLYCDFYSLPGQPRQRMAKYVDLVLREAELWSGGKAGPTVQPRTVFFGGGTPSLLPLAEMRRLLHGLRELLDLSQVDEWTVECNPATVDLDYCAMLRECGVNRLSFGAQSFDPAALKTLDRQHRPGDVGQSLALARAAGFSRLSLDLIFAIPGQDLRSWERSLEAAVALQTEHLSCYALTYEPNTPLTARKRLGSVVAAEEELELAMLHRARLRLGQAGLRAYEISNFARPGAECRHNLLYWNGGNYAGLGPAAASHVDGRRWRNRPDIEDWELAIQEGRLPAVDVEQLTARQRAGELAMLQLRLADGVSLEEVQNRTGLNVGEEWRAAIAELAELGLLELRDGRMRLTDRGINVADSVAARFV